MQQQNGDTTFRSGLHDMHADAICVYRAMFKIHGNLIFQSGAIVTDKDFLSKF